MDFALVCFLFDDNGLDDMDWFNRSYKLWWLRMYHNLSLVPQPLILATESLNLFKQRFNSVFILFLLKLFQAMLDFII